MTLLQLSSDLAFYGLAGTAAITFVGAVDPTNSAAKRKALAIETVVNVIAAWVYTELRPALTSGNISRASDLRYVDWFLTTPLLIASFAIYLTNSPTANNAEGILRQDLMSPWLVGLLVANAAMIICGFKARGNPSQQGSVNNLFICAWLAFAFIAAVLVTFYYYVYMVYIFLAVWALYGLAFLEPVPVRETMYNVLDVFSKSAFGIFLYLNWPEDGYVPTATGQIP
jgi:bacteriorhodopsin